MNFNYKVYAVSCLIFMLLIAYLFYMQLVKVKLEAVIKEQKITIAVYELNLEDAVNKLEKAKLLQSMNYRFCDERISNRATIQKIVRINNEEDTRNFNRKEDGKQSAEVNIINDEVSKASINYINTLLLGLQQ